MLEAHALNVQPIAKDVPPPLASSVSMGFTYQVVVVCLAHLIA